MGQVALDEMNAAPCATKVIEILEALLKARPTHGVLEDDDYEDAFAPQLAEPLDSPVGALVRMVCATWKSLGHSRSNANQESTAADGAQAMALLEGYAALAQLQETSTEFTSSVEDACRTDGVAQQETSAEAPQLQ